MRACERCGTEFTPQLSTARFCSGACRAAASRARRDGLPVSLVRRTERTGPGPVEVATAAHLGALVESPLGAGALALARVMDDEASTPAAFVAASRELRAALASLSEQIPRVPDELDMLEERRKARARAAGIEVTF